MAGAEGAGAAGRAADATAGTGAAVRTGVGTAGGGTTAGTGADGATTAAVTGAAGATTGVGVGTATGSGTVSDTNTRRALAGSRIRLQEIRLVEEEGVTHKGMHARPEVPPIIYTPAEAAGEGMAG